MKPSAFVAALSLLAFLLSGAALGQPQQCLISSMGIAGSPTELVTAFNPCNGAALSAVPFVTYTSTASTGFPWIRMGPDGEIYGVRPSLSTGVLRFDGDTGASLGVFATYPAGRGSGFTPIAFGPDGNLWRRAQVLSESREKCTDSAARPAPTSASTRPLRPSPAPASSFRAWRSARQGTCTYEARLPAPSTGSRPEEPPSEPTPFPT